MSTQALDAFMALKGIDPHFIDAWGKQSEVSTSNIKSLITSMGFDGEDEQRLAAYYQEKEQQHWLSILAPVSVYQQANAYPLAVHLPIDFVTDSLLYRVITEAGEQVEQAITATDFELLATQEISEVEFQLYEVELTLKLEQGYHQLLLLEPGNEEPLATTSLIITPDACFTPDLIKQGKKCWGTTVQLYGLKSKNNWGIGDFTDLKELVRNIAQQGGDFVGLNPIHALNPSLPENASPYSPISRKWLNIIYIDINAVAELEDCESLKSQINDPDFQDQLKQLQALERVDYKQVMKLKLDALRHLFNQLRTQPKNKRYLAFLDFVKDKGEALKQHAAYDALQHQLIKDNHHAWGWPVWPEDLQAYQNEAVQTWCEQNKDELLFWSYCQWLAELQLQEVDSLATSLGMQIGLYRDLAVGATKASSDVWANHELYCEQVSIGAPPDVLGPLGQSWGLPPMAPDKLHETGYQAFIDLLRANMRNCGALRIDHVMALLRLWWVPDNESADKGAYVYYNLYDLLNILALESVRNRCLVVGEDLGTVPDGMSELLQESGIYSYKVFFFEQAEDGGYISPSHYVKQALATLTTHDMATVKGYWHCEDLYLGRELGLYPDPEVFQRLLDDRAFCKQQILNSVHGHGLLPENFSRDANHTAMEQTLNYTLQRHLAHGSSALLSLQLEDFLEMEQPVNVPGTSDEYPNWQRKLSKDIDTLFNDENIKQLLKQITEARLK